MTIRPPLPEELELLVDIWLKSVCATHHFLTEDDIEQLLPPTRGYLTSDESELWVLSDAGTIVGFMGLDGTKLDALFLTPEIRRRGGGRQLVEWAETLKGELTVDVNEQNPEALRFYEACGFVLTGRSETDGDGRPFPLLHLHRRRS
jgi:putative acetyltransferase